MQDNRKRIGYLLKQAQHELRLALDKSLSRHGVTMPQYAAMNALEVTPQISGGLLARACFVTPQTMNLIIINLEKSGYVVRSQHPDNKNSLQTSLTRAGQLVLNRCHADVAEIESIMLAKMTKGEKETMVGMLLHCLENLASLKV